MRIGSPPFLPGYLATTEIGGKSEGSKKDQALNVRTSIQLLRSSTSISPTIYASLTVSVDQQKSTLRSPDLQPRSPELLTSFH